MEPSEELRQVATRFFEAIRDGDEAAVDNRVSRQPGFDRFGSDAAEWLAGRRDRRARLDPTDAESWAAGTAGGFSATFTR